MAAPRARSITPPVARCRSRPGCRSWSRLLDLAPWELPEPYQRTLAGRFGQRLRGRLLRDAAAVIVGSEAIARAARRAPPHPARSAAGRAPRSRPGSRSGRPAEARPAARRGSAPARADASASGCTSAISSSRAATTPGRPRDPARRPRPAGGGRPARRAAGDAPGRRGSCSSGAARTTVPRSPEPRPIDVGDALAYAPALPDDRLAALVRGARAAILPASRTRPACRPWRRSRAARRSSRRPVGAAAGGRRSRRDPRPAAGAGAAGRRARRRSGPTTRSTSGSRPPPGDRARDERRTWADVARETRSIYAEVGRPTVG